MVEATNKAVEKTKEEIKKSVDDINTNLPDQVKVQTDAIIKKRELVSKTEMKKAVKMEVDDKVTATHNMIQKMMQMMANGGHNIGEISNSSNNGGGNENGSNAKRSREIEPGATPVTASLKRKTVITPPDGTNDDNSKDTDMYGDEDDDDDNSSDTEMEGKKETEKVWWNNGGNEKESDEDESLASFSK